MTKNLSSASQDYLKIIYKLTATADRATTSQIAEGLAIKPASVTGMLRKMSQMDPPLVDYKKHQGVRLTEAGKEAALEMLRHHRLIELFLHEILGFPWDEVHDEADRLEHVISEKMERRIADVLGNPKRDPHGQLIPTYELELSATTEFPLSELRPPQQAVVRRVHDEDPELLRHLDQLGLRPRSRLTVLDYVPFDGNLEVRLGDQEQSIVLGVRITSQIFVDALADS
jgi:DtxR family Mn-dependent transcriptional regulator